MAPTAAAAAGATLDVVLTDAGDSEEGLVEVTLDPADVVDAGITLGAAGGTAAAGGIPPRGGCEPVERAVAAAPLDATLSADGEMLCAAGPAVAGTAASAALLLLAAVAAPFATDVPLALPF
jgi:hypothetical protein